LKVDEIRALKPKALAKHLETAHEEFFDLRFRLATKQLVNHREIRRVKKEIAKLKTIIRERELGIR
jgi:large subunit ribosomal protein L29